MGWISDPNNSLRQEFRRQLHEVQQGRSSVEALQLLSVRLDRTALWRELARGIAAYGDLELFYSILIRDRGASIEEEMSERAALVFAEIFTYAYSVAVANNFTFFSEFVQYFQVFFQLHGEGVQPSEAEYLGYSLGLSRADLVRIVTIIAEAVLKRAQELREAGLLTSEEATRLGPIL